MALLFLSGNIHQVDELFSVHSGGKRCAFMSLSALLTARNTNCLHGHLEHLIMS
jgi:hypothetical protein